MREHENAGHQSSVFHTFARDRLKACALRNPGRVNRGRIWFAWVGFGSVALAEPATGKNEFTPAPIVGGSSDVGIGGGVLASFAHRLLGYEPYLYRLELATTTTIRSSQSGTLQAPYQDYYLVLAMPHVRRNNTGVELRISYTRESNLKYYGLGNDSRIAPNTSLNDSHYEYVRTHPEARVRISQHLLGPLSSELRVFYAYNRLEVSSDSLLAHDRLSTNDEVRNAIHYSSEHSTLSFGYGLIVDLRDDPIAATRGQYYATRIDLSPGGIGHFPYRYARLDSTLRWYVPLTPEGSTLGLRITGDLLFGGAPIYELARFDDTSAFGGPNGVRGVPAERYHGRAKLFGNLQWRQVLFRFNWLSKSNAFALAVFVDAGRLWTDYHSEPALDGTQLGLKWGVGAGPHLIAGKSFLLRADVAWSPDARPIGAYFAAGEIF